MPRYLFLLLFSLGWEAAPLHACLILVLTGEDCTLVANHEDWFASNSQVRVRPGDGTRYGSLIFTFADEGWPQGGMNEKGLFFDGAYTPADTLYRPAAGPAPETFIWQQVLDRCASVAEALALLRRYPLPELAELHMVLADASGRAVVLGTDRGQLRVYERDGPYQLQTNFNRAQPALGGEPVCTRYQTAERLLRNDPACDMALAQRILAATHQDELTVYSNIYDLRRRQVRIYQRADFSRAVTLSLDSLLAGGEREVLISALFGKQTETAERPAGSYQPETSRPAENYRPETSERPADSSEDLDVLINSNPLTGRIVDAATGEPVPYVNLGVSRRGRGALADADGTFAIQLDTSFRRDSLTFSALGYVTEHYPVADLVTGEELTIRLLPRAVELATVTVRERALRLNRVARWGWMSGKDGILPLDETQGGAAVAVRVAAPAGAELVKLDKLLFRVLYSSQEEYSFRLRLYAVDPAHGGPGQELLDRTVLLTGRKRIGWVKVDLADEGLFVHEPQFFVALEWITTRAQRQATRAALADWERWKAAEFARGNPKVSRTPDAYTYRGDMRDWPGFATLPPLTALVVDDDVTAKNQPYRTYLRRQSLDTWTAYGSVVNLVVRLVY